MDHSISGPSLNLGGVGRSSLGLVRAAWRAWMHRRAVSRLLYADEHMLADIGLSRADVAGALEVPLLDDPSMHLVRARQERRRARGRRSN